MQISPGSLSPGSRLGPYEIVSLLGDGGMGVVWRARDTRLDREVAVKVLQADLAADPELRARFEREARTISRLAHPNICTLHDIGRHEGLDFLVMELLDGQTLAERLDAGPLPVDQLTRIGGEIATALAFAHRHGVVHRDLKPANVLLTRSGTKVLDFGLAKLTAGGAFAAGGAPGDATMSAPQERPLTAEGSILGTLHYMAPEQLEGQEADARSDLFALGALLYEMATGTRPFSGRSRASLIARILEHDPPPLSTLRPMTPPALERLVATCLAKEPDDRFQSARDVAHELRWIGEGAEAPAAAAAVSRAGWWAAGAALLLAVALGLVLIRGGRTTPPLELDLTMPSGLVLAATDAPPVLSPDGSTLAFGVTGADGESSIAVRRLDQRQIRRLEATTGGYDPFWSPDGRSLGFFTMGALHRVDIASGVSRRLAEIGDGRGGTWSDNGTILLTPAPDAGLVRVRAAGGPLEPVLTPDAAAGERGYWRPQFVDGDRFLYSVLPAKPGAVELRSGRLGSDATQLVGRFPTVPVWSAAGFLLYVEGATLLAQAVDAGSLALVGEPALVAGEVEYSEGYGSLAASLSASRTLAYQQRGDRQGATLTAYDREGAATLLHEAAGRNLDLSPDGKRLAFTRLDEGARADDVWTLELAGGTLSRLTASAAGEVGPVWSPDGIRLAYASQQVDRLTLFVLDLRTRRQTEIPSETTGEPVDWSPDGRYLLVETSETPDLVAVPWSTPGEPIVVAAVEAVAEHSGRWSPDGRWVAYVSGESGRGEIYVEPFPPDGTRWQVSSGGGGAPRWSGDGDEIFFVQAGQLMAAGTVTGSGTGFAAGRPEPLFAIGTSQDYEVAPDGQTFYVQKPAADASAPLRVVLGWQPPDPSPG